jgi:hypothetical protein
VDVQILLLLLLLLLHIVIIIYCKLLIFAGDPKVLRVINSPHDCLLLQSDINSVSDWCTANSMRLNIAETHVVSYIRKIHFLSYVYEIPHATITRTSSSEDLNVFFDSKLHFHSHFHYVFCDCITLLGLIRSITYRFSSPEYLYAIYFVLVRSKLEHASVVWTLVTATDASNLQPIQQKFETICI